MSEKDLKVIRASGADWLIGKTGQRKQAKEVRLERAPSPAEIDDVVQLMEDTAGAGKKLAGGLKQLNAALEQIRTCGLTPEAIITLTTDKCRPDKNNNPTTAAAVQRVLEGFFRLPEYLE